MEVKGSARAGNILLTGPPRVGKTTVVMRVVEMLGKNADGFYTEELRERGRRTGFLLRSLDGQEGLLAHVGLRGRPSVGRYTVNIEDLESVGVKAIERALRSDGVVVIDEIGRMEIYSEAFRKAVLKALSSRNRVLATIREGGEPFCDGIKGWEDVMLVQVSEGNRDDLPARLANILLEGRDDRPHLDGIHSDG